MEGGGGFFLDLERQLGGETHHAQHAYRILAIAGLGIADDAKDAGLQVIRTTDIVDDREVTNVVIERVDGEIAPHGIFFLRAENILVGRFHDMLVFSAAIIAVEIISLFVFGADLFGDATGYGTVAFDILSLATLARPCASEGGHFDDLAPETH